MRGYCPIVSFDHSICWILCLYIIASLFSFVLHPKMKPHRHNYMNLSLLYIFNVLSLSVLGTIVFEEGGIAKDDTAFGKQYIQYRKEVNAFIPNWKSIKTVLGFNKVASDNKQK